MARAKTHLFAGGFALLAGLLGATQGFATQSDYALPSGHSVRLAEVVWGGPETGPLVRFRFLDEGLGARMSGEGFVDAEADTAYLCETVALPEAMKAGAAPTQIIISISDRFLPLGEADPEVVQLFEAYRVQNGACEWEGF